MIGFDAVKHLVLCRIEKRPPRLNLLAHPYLPRAEVATFMHYNFCRQHKSLKGVSPAMAAGVTDRLWDIEDVVRLVDAVAPQPGPRGPYKKRNSN